MRYAIIENESRKVVNVVMWEGAEWLPPRNHLVIRSDKANIGDSFDETTMAFTSKEQSQ